MFFVSLIREKTVIAIAVNYLQMAIAAVVSNNFRKPTMIDSTENECQWRNQYRQVTHNSGLLVEPCCKDCSNIVSKGNISSFFHYTFNFLV